ncbi:hypothetical protein B296_00047892, partial [Ensete ventricosum]
RLSTMGIKGTLSGDIEQLGELKTLSLVTTITHLLQKILRYSSCNASEFTGSIPASLGKLSNLYWFDVADNQLKTDMNFRDLSNNTFDPSESPAWFSELQSLTALVIESGGLYGEVPQTLFSSPQLQQQKPAVPYSTSLANYDISTYLLRSTEECFQEGKRLQSREHSKDQCKGYLDPEYYMTQQLTDKSDVYSFGVVMLELITARQPIEKGKYIVREVKMAINANDEELYGLKELMDPAIQNSIHLIALKKFIELALRCLEESTGDRPTMSDVVKEIEMMLHADDLSTNSHSASSSATDFGNAKGVPHHPYISLSRKDVNSNAFEYSGGYSFSAKPEPK